jgi:hypothetical protein
LAALFVVLAGEVAGCGARTGVGDSPVALDDAGSNGDVGPEDAGADDLSERYCRCMTGYCFDGWPGNLSFDECVAFADGLHRAGSSVTTGDFIECRIHWCEVHITSFDNTHCDHARGQSVCVE